MMSGGARLASIMRSAGGRRSQRQKKRREQKYRATSLHKRTYSRRDDGKIDGKGANRKGEKLSDEDKIKVVITRGRGHGNLPKISKKADDPNRGNDNGEYPCGEDTLGFEKG